MYSRSNLSSSINRSLGENNTETGFSLQYVRSFDELKHILTESRKENQTNDSAENASKIEGVLIEEDDLIILNK